jgi:hypothetical protein
MYGPETRGSRLSSKTVMASRLALPLLLLILSEVPGAAQFGSPFPGAGGGTGYPGTGYPGGGGGIQLPGRRRNTANQPTDQLSGKLQRISTLQLVLDPGDGRNITVAIDRNTKYISNSGGSGRYGDFDTGDEVSIDAARDNQNYYHALRVSLLKKGSPADVSDAKPSGGSSETAAPSRSSSARSSSADDDPDRPVLKRAGSSAGSSTASAPSSTSSPASPASSDTSRETPRARIVSPDDDQTVTAPRRQSSAAARDVAPKPVPRESDDPGPPVLRRGAPARVDRTPPAGSETEIASSRPSIRAEDSNGVTRLPAAPIVGPAESNDSSHASSIRAGMSGPPSGDPVVQSAREAAWHFSETLPNYVVKQFTTRYQTEVAKGNRTSWQALDVVTADVIAEGGKETYKNILVNGKAPRDSVEKTGSWSTGEFVTIQLNLLAPQTDADFHNKRTTTIVNRAAYKYDYSVEQPNSNWEIHASAESYHPGYTGTIWIDKENFRVLRIEMSAKNMPKAFPLDAVESALDYDYVLIGDQKFLLPAHSESLSCIRGTSECTRNVIDFRNYRKFGADTSIKFETDNK